MVYDVSIMYEVYEMSMVYELNEWSMRCKSVHGG